MENIDYDGVADLYDLYVNTDYDFAFFVREIRARDARVLELASGTGRLSIPLIEAGADLTCVDVSRRMLNVLSAKLQERRLRARVVCSDVCEMDFRSEFELAIFPFQSFMELVGKENQFKALLAINRSLKPKGRFICTMHNPVTRRRSVDGNLHLVGKFRKGTGTLIVTGFEQNGAPVVDRSQLLEYYNESGILEWKRLLDMRFELIEKETFETMANRSGFGLVALYGDYDRSPFEPTRSPVMIWVLEKLDA